MRKIFFITLFILLFLDEKCFSQDIFRLNVDTISSRNILFQEAEDTLMITEKKKKKKNIYFGIKTKKGFIRTTSGSNLIYENFNFIKEPEIVNVYAQELFFYDKKKKKVVKSKKILEEALMMHGPYLKRIGEQIIEEGFFYYGLKHGRWVRFNRSDILQDKEFFSLGWYDESIRTYWDLEKKKMKEIIPIKFGEKNGTYFAFFENGDVAAKGYFLNDKPIDLWTEYYISGKKKREIEFKETDINLNQSFIVREWNINGKLIYDRNLYLNK